VQRYEKLLSELARRGRLRRLEQRRGADFCSNDYLALAGSSAIRRALEEALDRGVPAGAGASRLLRGNDPEHEALEVEAARFFGAERTLFFSSGFLANFAIWSLLPDRSDVVVHDVLIHASCREGMRAGAPQRIEVAHNDANAVEDAISGWRSSGGRGRPWIAVESVYSMDGDKAPLDDLMAISARHDAMLVIDEAHASGVFGPEGRGLAAAHEGNPHVMCLHTCGKALGASGALVCGSAPVVDFLINRSRPFIYSTAPSPLMAVAVRAALVVLEREPERRIRLLKLIEATNRSIHEQCDVPPTGSQIIPVILGSSPRTMQLASALQSRGFDVRGIRPPTVPEGTARLRLSLTLNIDQESADAMVAALAEELQRLGP